ncbi:hypothetical protein DPMN_122708 [Dreissena polymorpha]|uniref:Uncharacterized protein n=1 Tax=Dreissena polymorpha TaxID=45954 RepID=A0A9D4JQL7_DREPO|nr:hypothetical protein DPMN_122708 [Dreissena polymorpha]
MAEYDECFLIYDMDSDVPFYGFDEEEFKIKLSAGRGTLNRAGSDSGGFGGMFWHCHVEPIYETGAVKPSVIPHPVIAVTASRSDRSDSSGIAGMPLAFNALPLGPFHLTPHWCKKQVWTAVRWSGDHMLISPLAVMDKTMQQWTDNVLIDRPDIGKQANLLSYHVLCLIH